MYTKFLYLIILIYAATALCSEEVPESRLVDWRNAGLYKNRFSIPIGKIINITAPGYNATPDNDSDDDYDAIQKAIIEARDIEGLYVIYFPPGVYHVKQSIVLSIDNDDGNIVFIGAGESTVLNFPSLKYYNGEYQNSRYPFKINGKKLFSNRAYPTSNLNKGETEIHIYPSDISRLGLEQDDWIHITEYNSPRITKDYSPDYFGQFFQISSVDQSTGTVSLKSQASIEYKVNYGLSVIKLEPIENVGIENMKIYREKQSGDKDYYSNASNVLFSGAVNCWIKGVHFYQTFQHHVICRSSAHLEISGCYFEDAYYIGDGGYGYGVDLGSSVTSCLIENNIFRLLRHTQVVQDGANTNVFGYNYSREQEWKVDISFWRDNFKMPDNTGQDITIHGDYPFANLFEGNSAINIWADDVHGLNGPYNTFLRNYTSNPRSDLIDAAQFEKIEYVNFIGNIHIDNIRRYKTSSFLNLFTLEYPDGYPWDYYNTREHNDELGSYHFLNEISYYYCDDNYQSDISYKPEFLDGYDWPPIGSPTNLEYDEIIEYHDHQNPPIPAEDRWKNQSIKTYNSYPIISTVPSIALPSEISSSSTLSGIFEVAGTVIINNEASLTIKAGSKILMRPGSSLLTENGGKIIADGKSSEKIEFKRFDADQAWNKIELRSNGNRFSYCNIDGGTNNVHIKGKDNIFSYCDISNAAQGGFRTAYTYGTSEYSDYSILDCNINNNRYGVYSYKSYGDIQSSRIYNNSLYGLRIAYSKVGDNSAITDYNQYFTDNIIHDNGTYGIYILTSGNLHSGFGTIQGRNKIINNGRHEIYMSGKSAMIYGNESTYGNKLWSSIFDNVNANSSLNKYISNYAKTPERQPVTVYAHSTYWGTSNGPSPDNFRGYYVDYSNYLTSDTSLFESPSLPENSNYQMIVIDDYDLNQKPELSQTSQYKIGSDQMNSMIADTKTRLLEIRNEMKKQKDQREINRNLHKYFRVYSSHSGVDVIEQTEINKILENYADKLEELSIYDYGDINNSNIAFTPKSEAKFLAETAAMQKIFLLHGEHRYDKSLKLINENKEYINNFDHRKELLSLKMDCFYTLGQNQEAYYTLKELKKHIYEDHLKFDIPTYEEFERDLCEELNIEYGMLDKQVAEEYQEEQGNQIPTQFGLKRSFPNPFNPVTTIPFDLPENSHVKIKVFNVLGQLVTILVDDTFERGSYERKFNGENLASGMYIIQANMLSTGNSAKKYTFIQKILLMK